MRRPIIEDLTLMEVLQLIVVQARKGYKYAATLGAPSNPDNLYYWLKSRVTFVDDHINYEQLQQIETLLGPNNVHGIKGAGDCDCFTIAMLSLLYNAGYNSAYLVLVGNNLKEPTHIFPAIDYLGGIYPLDVMAIGPNQYKKGNSKGLYKGIEYVPIAL